MTIRDIAKLAGVSVATVSKVINEKDEGISDETRAKIEAIIVENNYVPYRKVIENASGQSKLIALLISDASDIFCAELVRGVEDYCFQYGYSVVVCSTDNDSQKEAEYIHQLTKQNVQGIIRFTTTSDNAQGVKYLEHQNIYNVTLDDSDPTPNALKTSFNNKKGAYLATEHCIENGHHRIGFVSPVSQKQYIQDRYLGYQEALQDNGFAVEEDLVYHLDTEDRNLCGYQGAMYLMAKKVSAIFCNDDHVAIGAYRAIAEQGLRIPEDISVIGFDDTPFCPLLNPPLTSIKQSAYLIGENSAELLYKKITGAPIENPSVQIEPQLIERNSVSSPNGTKTAIRTTYILCGELYADCTMDVEPDGQATQRITKQTITVGGDVVMKAKELLSPKSDVYLLGHLGNDAQGRALYEQLQAMGIHTAGIAFVDGKSTSMRYITKCQGIQNTMVLAGATFAGYDMDQQPWILHKTQTIYCDTANLETVTAMNLPHDIANMETIKEGID